MKKNVSFRKNAILFFISVLAFVNFSFTYPPTKHESLNFGNVETSDFSPNTVEGWHSLQTYLNTVSDSVEFELILRREVPVGNKWNKPTLIGTIGLGFLPGGERIFEFKEPNRLWLIKIFGNGKVYIQLKKGPEPSGDIIVLPLKTRYMI